MKMWTVWFLSLILLANAQQQSEHKKRWRHNFVGKPKVSPVINDEILGWPAGEGSSLKRKRQNDGDKENLSTTAKPDAFDNTTAEIGSTTEDTISTSQPTTTPSTTTLASTTTTTTEVPMMFPNPTPNKYFCLCDMTASYCDMNCCCDPDCSPEKKTLFTGCEASLIYDPLGNENRAKSCVNSYIMYRENIPYRVDRTDPSMLCVVRENVQKVEEFSKSDMDRIKTRISHGRINHKPKYSWDHTSAPHAFPSLIREPYKYGKPVWVLKPPENENESNQNMLTVPAPYMTNVCTLNQPVLYLLDSHSTCVVPLPNLQENCEKTTKLNANTFIRNFLVVASPNQTSDNGADFPLLNIIVTEVCNGSTAHCINLHENTDENWEIYDETQIDFPVPVKEGKVCKNVLSQLNLTVVHSGIQGINHILAKALLEDVPLNKTNMAQTFVVKFIWSSKNKEVNNTNSTMVNDLMSLKPLPRSGNPGYLTGKPLILALKVTESVPLNETSKTLKQVQRMKVPFASPSLTIQSPGDCPEKVDSSAPRHNIRFGYEHISTCRLPLHQFTYCPDLQHHINSIVFGMELESFKESQFHVASYGNPDAFPTDWVPLTLRESQRFEPSSDQQTIQEGCMIVQSFHVTVAFAYTGPVDSPQAKITGVFYEPEDPVQVSSENKDVSVTTTVSFVDLTGKPTSRVATWPVLSIRLPSDFFYPFSSSTTNAPSKCSRIFMSTSMFSFVIVIQMVVFYF